MVRCGVVSHPRQWAWVGLHEIMGERRRYRLLDLEQLCWRLGAVNIGDVRRNLAAALDEMIARQQMKRTECWTEGLAVGSVGFLKQIQPLILSRRQTDMVQEQSTTMWVLKEDAPAYGQKTNPKKQCKALN
jgi:putative transposase